MIRERKEEDTDAIVEVWYSAFSLAHPFIENAFKEKVKKDTREISLTEPFMISMASNKSKNIYTQRQTAKC